jgi:hypothetical protein
MASWKGRLQWFSSDKMIGKESGFESRKNLMASMMSRKEILDVMVSLSRCTKQGQKGICICNKCSQRIRHGNLPYSKNLPVIYQRN